MRNKGHIITDLGQSGFWCPGVLPVLFIEALMCLLKLILRLGRYHRTHLVMKNLLRLANHDHFPVYVIYLVNGLEILIAAKLSPLELGIWNRRVHFILVFSGPPCFYPLLMLRQAFLVSLSFIFLSFQPLITEQTSTLCARGALTILVKVNWQGGHGLFTIGNFQLRSTPFST